MDINPWLYPVLFAAGFVAGLVDAIAGGGGIIALPVFLNLGFPAPLALGTNKLQASCGSVAAVWRFRSGGLVRLSECRLGIAFSFAGSLVGALLVRWIDPNMLGRIIPWVLVALIGYFAIRPEIGARIREPRMQAALFAVSFGLGLGFYDGFFGPGVGSFWMVGYVLALGMDFPRASAHAKVMNCASNLAALALFAASGFVQPLAGIVMGAGQVIGARIGAGLVLTRGARFVRPVFLVMAAATVLRLLLWRP